jgi:hypothetical protein
MNGAEGELSSAIVEAATERYCRSDVVVVKGGFSHDITVHDAHAVPDAVEESDHHEVIHAPEGWDE